MLMANTGMDPAPTTEWGILSLVSASPSWPDALLLLACSALPKYIECLFLTLPFESVVLQGLKKQKRCNIWAAGGVGWDRAISLSTRRWQ